MIVSSAKPRAALFDMDRTLVRVDTATLYVRYERHIGEADWRDTARVAWWLLQYTLGVIDVKSVAKKALAKYAGREEREMIERCETWFADWVLPHVCADGRRAVREHREAGDVVAIVTSATPYAARPLAAELGIEHVVCNHLEVDDGLFTGRVETPFCYGRGKIECAEALAAELGFDLDEATFYSDSITDLPLLSRVGTPVCVNPDVRLRRHARREGWRVERW